VSRKHTYFTIPFEMVPQEPPYTVWFASWTSVKPRLSSEETPRPFVVGVTKTRVPKEGTPLGTGHRSPNHPPPPPPSPVSVSLASYQEAFGNWLQTGIDTEDYKYFIIPFDGIPASLGDAKLWFATWSSHRPEIAQGVHPPFAVGVVSTPSEVERGLDTPSIPQQATVLTIATKDPPIPPPAAPVPGTSLEGYSAWLDERSAE
jgi:hypothetical protein